MFDALLAGTVVWQSWGRFYVFDDGFVDMRGPRVVRVTRWDEVARVKRERWWGFIDWLPVVHVYVGEIFVRGRPRPVRLNTLWRPSRAIDLVLTRVP